MQAPVVSIADNKEYTGQIAAAVKLLQQGKLVVLPTETVYGAAGVLTESSALARLRALRDGGDNKDKGSVTKPFIPHVADARAAGQYLGAVSDLGNRMMRKVWPGPVALVFDVSAERQLEVAAKMGVKTADLFGEGRVTLRCPDNGVALDVIEGVGKPIVMVRAGVQSRRLANRADAVVDELQEQVDMVLDAGPPRFSKPSTIVHVKGDTYEILRTGVYDDRILQRMLRTTILFVCSGNTCRSPMAEALARRVLATRLKVSEGELENKGISVVSAGSMAMPGARATPQAVEALQRIGVDISQHRSQTLSVELIHEADLIYTMGKNHAQIVRALVPAAMEKTKTLAPDKEIDDPIGGDVELYSGLAAEMQKMIETRLSEQPIL